MLVAPTNSASATAAAQAGIRHHALMVPLLALGFSATCPPVLFAGVFAALGDVTRGCAESQLQLFDTPGTNPAADTMTMLLCVDFIIIIFGLLIFIFIFACFYNAICFCLCVGQDDFG
jgi:hypothetical protein